MAKGTGFICEGDRDTRLAAQITLCQLSAQLRQYYRQDAL